MSTDSERRAFRKPACFVNFVAINALRRPNQRLVGPRSVVSVVSATWCRQTVSQIAFRTCPSDFAVSIAGKPLSSKSQSMFLAIGYARRLSSSVRMMAESPASKPKKPASLSKKKSEAEPKDAKAVPKKRTPETQEETQVPRFMRPVVVQGALAEWLATDMSTRSHIIRSITAYVKDHNLQKVDDRATFRCDETLRKLFAKDEMRFIELIGAISPFVKRPNDMNDESFIVRAKNFECKIRLDLIKESEEKRVLDAKKATDKQERLKKRRDEKTGIYRHVRLSPALSQVCGGETEMARPEILKSVWAYIRENKLQDPEQRRTINNDEKLKAVFGNENKTDYLKITGFISANVSPIAEASSKSAASNAARNNSDSSSDQAEAGWGTFVKRLFK
mmetsp:Transcript_12788/g.21917  ORF Transcript_12788/g.21917 Transcript_12788/m.21917 type:complete len:391 (-) Transcript_12788:129-1301(-)